MFHCPRCLSGFARKMEMELHSEGCSEERPSHDTLVQMVGMLMTRVQALEERGGSLKEEKRKRGKEEEQATVKPPDMPTLEERDLLGFLENGVKYVVDKYDWPIKAFGKTLKWYQDGGWVMLTPAALDDLTNDYFVRNLHQLLNDYTMRKNLFEDPDNFYANSCSKVMSLESSDVKTAFMKTA